MVSAKDIAIIGGLLVGGYIVYDYMKHRTIIGVAQSLGADQSQRISTSGQQLTYRNRTTYNVGNSGSIREIENHVRGEAVTPKTWRGSYGSILQPQVTFSNGAQDIRLSLPEMEHVTPEIEAYLQASQLQQTWDGYPHPSGTFG